MKIYTLHTKQNLPISIETAWEFLSSPKNLKIITPDYMGFKILSGDEKEMFAGQIIQYIVTPVLGIPMKWVTEITHVVDKKCPGGVCKPLIHFEVLDNCIGCTKCATNCPVSCISGSLKELHFIDTSACIKCGICKNVCPVDAIISV